MSSSSAWALFWRAFQAGGFSERPSLLQRKDAGSVDHPDLAARKM
jgi:hypothetical protein